MSFDALDFSVVYPWLDLIWIPVTLLVLQKGQWLKTICFILACVLALRLQVELMEDIGFPNGFLSLMDYPLLERGFVTYGLCIAGFLLMAYYSRNENAYVFIAASISTFMVSFIISSVVLIL